MDVKDVIVLVIAIWGAILSTVLAVREFLREKRNIKITLIHKTWADSYAIAITNIGYRPITISEIGMSINDKNKKEYLPTHLQNVEWVRSHSLFDFGDSCPIPEFPIILTDGQTSEFRLSQYVTNELNNSENHMLIYVYDIEGNIFTKYRTVEHDEKYAHFTEK